MNRIFTLALAGAGTPGLIIVSLLVYPPFYAYQYYPQANSVSMSIGIAYKQEINQNGTIIKVTETQLSQYPQIKEGMKYLKDKQEGKASDLSSYYLIGEQCSYGGDRGGGCYPLIPFKISDIPKVAKLLGVQAQLKDGIVLYLEYNGDYYVMSLYQPDLQPIYNSALLYGIIVSIIGSLAIWLWVARTEARRSREADEKERIQ